MASFYKSDDVTYMSSLIKKPTIFIYKQAFKQLARDTVSPVYSVLTDVLSATTAGDYLLGFQLGGALEWIGQEEEGHDCNALKSLELFNTDDEKQARFFCPLKHYHLATFFLKK